MIEIQIDKMALFSLIIFIYFQVLCTYLFLKIQALEEALKEVSKLR